MNKHLDETLVKKFPLIFADRYKTPTESLMCFGFEVDDGWYDLIDTLCGQIQHHIDFNLKRQKFYLSIEDIPQVVAVQVKEKFGTLRFYYDGGDKYIEGLVSMAEAMSAKICMTCGKPGELITTGWWHVACDEHKPKLDNDAD